MPKQETKLVKLTIDDVTYEVPEGMNILYVVALGYAAETPMWEDGKAGELKYYLDAEVNAEYKERMARLLGYCYPDESIFYIE